jgi:hypothetical protein
MWVLVYLFVSTATNLSPSYLIAPHEFKSEAECKSAITEIRKKNLPIWHPQDSQIVMTCMPKDKAPQ